MKYTGREGGGGWGEGAGGLFIIKIGVIILKKVIGERSEQDAIYSCLWKLERDIYVSNTHARMTYVCF